MECKQRAKMPAYQRAKQFMPFAAVKGLEKAIAEQDKLLNRTEQIVLEEEQVRVINEQLKLLQKGKIVSARFYTDGQYQTVQGAVEEIDSIRNVIRIAGIAVSIRHIIELYSSIYGYTDIEVKSV